MAQILEISLVDRRVTEHCITLAVGDGPWIEQLYNRVVDDPSVHAGDEIWNEFEAWKVSGGDIVGAARVRWRATSRA
jgi:hypothetical protein